MIQKIQSQNVGSHYSESNSWYVASILMIFTHSSSHQLTLLTLGIMDWIHKKNSYVEALTPNVTVYGDRVFRKVTMVKWGYKSEAQFQ